MDHSACEPVFQVTQKLSHHWEQGGLKATGQPGDPKVRPFPWDYKMSEMLQNRGRRFSQASSPQQDWSLLTLSHREGDAMHWDNRCLLAGGASFLHSYFNCFYILRKVSKIHEYCLPNCCMRRLCRFLQTWLHLRRYLEYFLELYSASHFAATPSLLDMGNKLERVDLQHHLLEMAGVSTKHWF